MKKKYKFMPDITFDEAQNDKGDIQYMCEEISKQYPEYFLEIADELIRTINRYRAEAEADLKLEKLDTDNDGDVDKTDVDKTDAGKTDVGNIAKSISAYKFW